jgi:hypothetical protein
MSGITRNYVFAPTCGKSHQEKVLLNNPNLKHFLCENYSFDEAVEMYP